jgi:hypothetical protein
LAAAEEAAEEAAGMSAHAAPETWQEQGVRS